MTLINSMDKFKKQSRLSKFLAYVLRHNGVDMGLNFRPDGYTELSVMLKMKNMKEYSVKDVQRVVDTNEKKRYTLLTDSKGKVWIRANQGHSGKVSEAIDQNLLLEEITDYKKIPICIHGTNKKAYEIIKEQGLSKRERHGIHFAAGTANDESVISGMRKSAKVMIYIDVEKAMRDGLKFFVSTNGVILSPGNSSLKDGDGYSGVILPEYFSKVEFVK